MIVKGAVKRVAAPKKVEEPAAAPKKERKIAKVINPVVIEPVIGVDPVIEHSVVEEATEVAEEQ